jgi:four helix bundle protein
VFRGKISKRAEMGLKSYKDLLIWQKGIELVREIYTLTNLFPKDEMYGLSSQMQRAAVSIPSNIAEGYFRKHRKEFIHFLAIALGSAAELETQITISKSLDKFKHLDFSIAENLTNEIMKMTYVMIDKLHLNLNANR